MLFNRISIKVDIGCMVIYYELLMINNDIYFLNSLLKIFCL